MSSTGTVVTELYCPTCKKRYDIHAIMTICPCGSPLLVDYDYKKAARAVTPEILKRREPTMWKYHELLPVFDDENIISLGEGGTPLLRSRSIGIEWGMKKLTFKDEAVNPTGSFKARGLGMMISRAKELGITKVIIPTAGNAGSAVAAYAARAGIDCKIIMPKDVPAPFLVDCVYHGAQVELVEGSIKDCGIRAAELVKSEGWFSAATLKEPYRIEGKKTMGYELAEQFDYTLPDVIIYPTGGGTGLIGMWKAFREMQKLGWLTGPLPKMVSVQADGCAPIPKAYVDGAVHAEEWPNPQTLAAGLRVPSAIGDFLMLEAIRESGGTAEAVSDDELMEQTMALASREGIFSSPEGGASLACLRRLLDTHFVSPDDSVVVFITGSGYKYLDILQAALPQKR